MRIPLDMEGRELKQGQIVLFACAYGSSAKIEKREICSINEVGVVRLKPIGSPEPVRGGYLTYPERLYIIGEPI